MKLLFIVGTRPDVIKLFPIIESAKKHPEKIKIAICATGQQRDMQKQALSAFSLQPDFNLDVMEANQTLAKLSENLMREITKTLHQYQPDWVIVQGDTTTAFIGGLAAFYQHIKIAHVEAGLRTDNLKSPFPEELNRQLISKFASLHFAPTKLAANNLKKENISKNKILITGNTIVDSIQYISKKWEKNSPILPKELEKILSHSEKKFILITCHRRESFGEPLIHICRAIKTLCEKYPEFTWIYPVHPNPNIKEIVFRELNSIKQLHLVSPLDYEAMLYLINRSCLVLTDSGGIQEEAPTFHTPVIVMRDHTERQEGIDAGFATLAGTTAEKIIELTSARLNNFENKNSLKNNKNPYGDGKAGERIIRAILDNNLREFT